MDDKVAQRHKEIEGIIDQARKEAKEDRDYAFYWEGYIEGLTAWKNWDQPMVARLCDQATGGKATVTFEVKLYVNAVTYGASGASIEDMKIHLAKSKAAAILGSIRTEKKSEAARMNGAKGGRPKKEVEL